MISTHIGIDFGTTNTAVFGVLVDEHGTKPIPFGEDGEYPFASIVAIRHSDGKMLFGRDVKRRRGELSADHTIVSSIKSFLNSDNEIVANGKRYKATDITANFLLFIKDYIKRNHGIDVTDATFAFPVDFKPEGRTALKAAAEAAGIKVNAFISESTAAYIANKEKARAYSKVMVIDWGGGTVDISILEERASNLYEVSVLGEKIGGDDIDRLLAERVHSKLVAKTKIMVGIDEMTDSQKDTLIAQAERTKINFSTYDDDDVSLRNYGEFGTPTISLDYAYFCDVVRPIIKDVLAVVDKAMAMANTSKAGIDAVILVGGSCALRPFNELIASTFGDDKILLPSKMQWSVANGAALIDIVGGDYCLNDNVCVVLSDETPHPIIEKGAKVGYKGESLHFALTEDVTDAHFIFNNGEIGGKKVNYGIKIVNTKGFLRENLEVSCSIGMDQIARVVITDKAMGDKSATEHTINKLKYYYDLSKIKNL